FTVSHCIVREYIDGRQFHQCCEANGRPRVIAEDQKRSSKRTEFRQRESVRNGCHRVLAYAEVQILSTWILGFQIPCTCKVHSGTVCSRQIPGASQEPGTVLRKPI